MDNKYVMSVTKNNIMGKNVKMQLTPSKQLRSHYLQDIRFSIKSYRMIEWKALTFLVSLFLCSLLQKFLAKIFQLSYGIMRLLVVIHV